MNDSSLQNSRESLQPTILIYWIGMVALLSGIVQAALLLVWFYRAFFPIVYLSIIPTLLLGIGTIYCWLKYRAWSYELQEDGLHLSRGVLVKVDTLVPYIRIQHIDTQRGPIDRLLGLSSTIVFTAGSRGADVLIPGLDKTRAVELQDELRSIIKEEEHRLMDAV